MRIHFTLVPNCKVSCPCSLVVCYMAACVTYYETVKTDYRLLQQVTTLLALPQNISLPYCVGLATLFS